MRVVLHTLEVRPDPLAFHLAISHSVAAQPPARSGMVDRTTDLSSPVAMKLPDPGARGQARDALAPHPKQSPAEPSERHLVWTSTERVDQ
jgi:hypothetical protein